LGFWERKLDWSTRVSEWWEAWQTSTSGRVSDRVAAMAKVGRSSRLRLFTGYCHPRDVSSRCLKAGVRRGRKDAAGLCSEHRTAVEVIDEATQDGRRLGWLYTPNQQRVTGDLGPAAAVESQATQHASCRLSHRPSPIASPIGRGRDSACFL
jgi:hypothetical protein